MSITPCLHIYAQPYWHAEAYIIGDRKALQLLRDSIDVALQSGNHSSQTFANDGEGYMLCVMVNEKMEDIRLPYTDEIAYDGRLKSPHEVYPHER